MTVPLLICLLSRIRIDLKKLSIMKKIILVLTFFLTATIFANAQSAPYNVVFDVTSKDTVVHQMVIRWIKEITSTHPEANIEVVFYAKSLDMVTKDKSVVTDEVLKYAGTKNVKFRVCEIALKNNNLDK